MSTRSEIFVTHTTRSHPKITFDPETFLEYFQKNYERTRPKPEDREQWPVLSSEKLNALKKLLARLALGEISEEMLGARLIHLAASATDQESLRYYVKEEKRHGEELLWLAQRFNLELNTDRPDFGARLAMWAARMLNIGRLVDVANLLLVAEVVVLTLYREVAYSSNHPLVKSVFIEIIRDEAGHLRYHGKRVSAELNQAGWWGRLVLKAGHQAGLFLVLFITPLVLGRSFYQLTGLRWKQVLGYIERDYYKFYKSDLAFFRSDWIFRICRLSFLR